jgi:hypothetical protein
MSDKHINMMSDLELRGELLEARQIIDIQNRVILEHIRAAKCFHERCHSTTYSDGEGVQTIVYTCLKCQHVWSDV